MTKISELPDIDLSDLSSDDIIIIVDGTTGVYNKISLLNFIKNIRDAVPAVKATITGNPTIYTGVELEVSFTGVDYDTDSMWTISSDKRLTCNTPGKYLLNASTRFNTSGTTGVEKVWIEKNGVVVSKNTLDSYSMQPSITVTALIDLDVDDYVTLHAWQTSGADVVIFGSSTILSAVRLG